MPCFRFSFVRSIVFRPRHRPIESSAINRRRFIAALAASPKGIGGMPGGMLALSSNGASPNTGIVWGLAPIDGDAKSRPRRENCPRLRRDESGADADRSATPRLKLLWDSQRARVAYTHSKFSAPVVADGKLFVPTYDGRVDMYTL